MLQTIQEGSHSKLLKGFLLSLMTLGVVGLVMTDVGGFFRGGVPATTVARIGDQDIKIQEFDRSVRRVLSAQGIGIEEAYRLGLIGQILESQIQDMLLAQEAGKLGLRVSEEQLAKQIASLLEPLAQEGVSRKQTLQLILRNQGMTENDFIAAIRSEMTAGLLRKAVEENARYAPAAMIADIGAFTAETRDVRAVIFKTAEAPVPAAPTDEQLRSYFETVKEDFVIPERRNISYIVLDEKAVKAGAEVTDEELRALYDKDAEAFTVPESRVVEQAVLKSQDQAEQVAAKVRAGAPLKAAIKDVTGDMSAYLGKNNFNAGGLQEQIAKPVFSSARGDLAGPVQTPLGWHVLIVEDIAPAHVQSFDEVKETLRQEHVQEKLSNLLFEISGQIDDKLAAGQDIATVAAEMELPLTTVEGLDRFGSDAKGAEVFAAFEADKNTILESISHLQEGESGSLIELSGGRLMGVTVTGIKPQTYKDIGDIRATLVKRWAAARQETANRDRAQDALAAVEKGGKSLDQIGTAQVFTALQRMPQDEKTPFGPPALRQIFLAEKDGYALVEHRDGLALVQVTHVNLPAEGKNTALLREGLIRQQKTEYMQQYLDYLRRKWDVRINKTLLDRTYSEQTPSDGAGS